MPSTYSTDLKLELMVTGEKAGLWGNITNTNLNILQQAIGGYEAIALNATTGATLTFSNGTTSDGKNAVLNLTGTLTSSVNVIVPDTGSGTAPEKTYIVKNSTSGAFAVTFKTTSGTGATFAAADKGFKLVYSDGTDVVDTGFVANAISAVVQDTSPELGGNLDTNGFNISFDDDYGITDDSANEQLWFQKTASAVNEFTITNAATGTSPDLSVTGDDTNIGLSVTTKGTGLVLFNDGAYNADATLTDGATITWDVGSSPVAKVTLAGNRTLSAPTNSAAGQFISLTVIQDATGSRTLTWNSAYEFTADTAPTLTTTASKADLFVFKYNGTVWLEVGKNLNLSIT
jgi:hypothetical protein